MPTDPKAFIAVDATRVQAEVADALRGLEHAGEEIQAEYKRALLQVAEEILGDAKEKAPAGEGDLISRGEISDESQGEEILILIGFNIVYAHIRDQGGVIRPKNAKALFIPLRKGARPGDPSLKLGVDFQLVPGPMTHKTEVRQTGNGYLTTTFEVHRGTLHQDVGTILRAFLVEGQ